MLKKHAKQAPHDVTYGAIAMSAEASFQFHNLWHQALDAIQESIFNALTVEQKRIYRKALDKKDVSRIYIIWSYGRIETSSA